jgi:succinate dehydrogenase hydrophobic anchor subunit
MNLIDTLREPKIPFTNGMVLFDWVATLGVAYLIVNNTKFLNIINSYNKRLFMIFMLLIFISIIIHKKLNIPTVSNYYLGLSLYPQRIK